MLQSFLNGLSKMTKQWQVLDEHGEIEDRDETSSIASDWSIMCAEDADKQSTRSASPSVMRSCSRVSLPNSLDSPVRQDPDARPSAGAAQFLDTPATKKLRPQRVSAADRADLLRHLDLPNPAESRQTAAKWNAVAHVNGKHARRSTLDVDAQRTKCLRRGAQISTGFQRKQVSLRSGGQLPQGRKSVAKT